MTPEEQKEVCDAVRRFLEEFIPLERVMFLLRVYGVTPDENATIVGDRHGENSGMDYDKQINEWSSRAAAEVERRAAVPSEIARLKAEVEQLKSAARVTEAEQEAIERLIEIARIENYACECWAPCHKREADLLAIVLKRLLEAETT